MNTLTETLRQKIHIHLYREILKEHGRQDLYVNLTDEEVLILLKDAKERLLRFNVKLSH